MGNIQMIGKSNAEAMRGEKPKLTNLSPEWTLTDVAQHAVDFWLTTEDLPRPDNRVTTDDDGHIHLAYTSSNDEEAGRLYGELKKILNHTGMAEHHVLGKNFYVDTSFFPSIGAVNPALTAMANAIRVGEHLLGRMS